MKEEIIKESNQDLIAIYRLLLEYKEYLDNEKKKMEDEVNEE